jgi:hypothetical protein
VIPLAFSLLVMYLYYSALVGLSFSGWLPAAWAGVVDLSLSVAEVVALFRMRLIGEEKGGRWTHPFI